MAQAHGQEHFIGVVIESTYGTPVTPPTLFFECLSDSLKLESGWTQKPELRSTSNVTRVKNKRKVSGSVSMQVPWDGMGTLIKWAMGTSTPSGSDPYTHAIALARALPFFTLYSSKDGDAISTIDQYSSCQITKLSLKQDMEEALIATIDFIGCNVAAVSKPTPSFSVKDVIEWTMLTSLTYNSAGTTVPCRSFELTIENPVYEDHYTLGSIAKTGSNRNGPRKIMLAIEAELSAITTRAAFQAGTNYDWVITYDDGANRNLTATIPNGVIIDRDDPVSDSGAIIESFTVQADQSAAELDELTISLKNATATI